MKTSKLRVTGLYAGNSPGTGEFPAQMASNAENVPVWWRHHVVLLSRKENLNNYKTSAVYTITTMVGIFTLIHRTLWIYDKNLEK